jgi:hypothetical protein
MVHVIHQRKPFSPANRQQVARSELPVIVLQRQPLPNPGTQQLDAALQPLQRRRHAASRPAHMQHHCVRTHQLGERALQLQLGH